MYILQLRLTRNIKYMKILSATLEVNLLIADYVDDDLYFYFQIAVNDVHITFAVIKGYSRRKHVLFLFQRKCEHISP